MSNPIPAKVLWKIANDKRITLDQFHKRYGADLSYGDWQKFLNRITKMAHVKRVHIREYGVNKRIYLYELDQLVAEFEKLFSPSARTEELPMAPAPTADVAEPTPPAIADAPEADAPEEKSDDVTAYLEELKDRKDTFIAALNGLTRAMEKVDGERAFILSLNPNQQTQYVRIRKGAGHEQAHRQRKSDHSGSHQAGL